MNPLDQDRALSFTRRQLLQGFGAGLGTIALTGLLRRDAPAAILPAIRGTPHFVPRARRVIYMHMVGGTSQIDLFDHKPVLKKHDGELCPAEFFVGKQLAFIRSRPTLLATPYEFQRSGASGITVSELLPHIRSIVDDLTVVKSMQTDQFNHGPAQILALTGFPRFGRPSVGAWISYGLGSENENLPAFVVLVTGSYLGAGKSGWGAGFIPTIHQGVELRSQGDPVLFVSDPQGVSRSDRRRVLDTVRALNEIRLADVGDPEIATRIGQYEMAFRMQTSVPEVMDIASEPDWVHEMYGTKPGTASFANNCLLARRLVERGVRFVQLFDADWDHHTSVFHFLPPKCRDVDQAVAALVTDLKQRGLLDDTLVLWTTEFGRTPMAQGTDGEGKKVTPGRDHHKEAYTIWMAGGGVKAGFEYGRTDEMGYTVVENPVHVHDLNATLLHLLGMDHKKLTFRFQGRDFRLTDVHGKVVRDLLA